MKRQEETFIHTSGLLKGLRGIDSNQKLMGYKGYIGYIQVNLMYPIGYIQWVIWDQG